MKILISDHFKTLLDIIKRYLIIYGGRGSGKSEFIGRKIFKRCMEEGGHKFLILRKVARDNDESTLAVMLSILDQNEILYRHNQTKKIIEFPAINGKMNTLFFDGMDNKFRIKSKKGITSIWCEELTEFSEPDFLEVDLILRERTPYYKQIIGSFNPDEAQAAWIKERFFIDDSVKIGPGKIDNSWLHWSTIEHNPIASIRAEYLGILEAIPDETKRKIYLQGMWALAKGLIYSWDVVPLPDITFDDVFYGLDFGFSVNPAALIRIYRKADEYWLEEIIYETGLTNPALGAKMKKRLIQSSDAIYADSAEPKSIQELCDMGFNVLPAIKGEDSVRAGIDFLKEKKIHICSNSPKIWKERKTYKYQEDKDGKMVNKPVKFDDHAMDGSRYGIYTDAKRGGVFAVVIG